jgi:hypothetical protein
VFGCLHSYQHTSNAPDGCLTYYSQEHRTGSGPIQCMEFARTRIFRSAARGGTLCLLVGKFNDRTAMGKGYVQWTPCLQSQWSAFGS